LSAEEAMVEEPVGQLDHMARWYATLWHCVRYALSRMKYIYSNYRGEVAIIGHMLSYEVYDLLHESP
jgi:hypothetical protein